MATSLFGYPLFISNNLSSSSTIPAKQKLKNLTHWTELDLPLNQGYFGLRIPSGKRAVTVVCYHLESCRIFAFNVTYPAQAQKSSQAILKKIEKSNLSPSSFKILKIYPYKNLLLRTECILNDWIASKFPESNVENISLKKNQCFIINSENGGGMKECQLETSLEKNVRRIRKTCLIFFM
jgi:hypothetical protein